LTSACYVHFFYAIDNKQIANAIVTYFISPFEKNYVYLYASFTHKTSHAMKRFIIILTLALCVWTIDAVAQTVSKDNDNTTSATLSPDKEPRIDGNGNRIPWYLPLPDDRQFREALPLWRQGNCRLLADGPRRFRCRTRSTLP
jgi:hypothetical protein